MVRDFLSSRSLIALGWLGFESATCDRHPVPVDPDGQRVLEAWSRFRLCESSPRQTTGNPARATRRGSGSEGEVGDADSDSPTLGRRPRVTGG
ncbi:MAG: hypothetical protein CM1200mP2_47060 [Planctomycetaceae bacterium]|nr:MAG: hypothetical protein CM1200mP2_47060 [Planctomycetaceae bacterium]